MEAASSQCHDLAMAAGLSVMTFAQLSAFYLFYG
jgi:hypothetical protein